MCEKIIGPLLDLNSNVHQVILRPAIKHNILLHLIKRNRLEHRVLGPLYVQREVVHRGVPQGQEDGVEGEALDEDCSPVVGAVGVVGGAVDVAGLDAAWNEKGI